MGMAVIMLILFYVSALKAGKDVTQELAGTTHWLVFPLIQAFMFTAGMSILMTGVRMFLAEITAAFVSISEKFIPNSRPALDVPTVFPFAPTAVIVGFLSAYVAGLLAVFIMVFLISQLLLYLLLILLSSQEERLRFLVTQQGLERSSCRIICGWIITSPLTNSSLSSVCWYEY